MNQQLKAAKQIIDMQKASAEIALNSLIAVWEQTAVFAKGAALLPEEGRRAIMQWVEINRKACEGLKSALETGYSNLEKFFPS